MTQQSPFTVNSQRLQQDIEALSSIGRSDDQGIYRTAFSAADMQARDWLKQRIDEAGLDYYIDGAANVHARLNWDGHTASVISGSHMDSVPGGGMLDGALGVVTALECLRRIKELGLEIKRPLEAIAFSDEEGRFGGIFGSSAICGKLTPQHIHQARDLEGNTLVDAMAQWGMNAMEALNATRKPDSVHAFVELHIEQGPVLDREQLNIGIVEAISGLFKWNIVLSGVAGHAGATPMHMRQDAFQGLAELSCEIPRIIEEHGSHRSVATIGRVDLQPGAANVVPGRVAFSLDVRDTNAETLNSLADAFRRAISAIARRRNLMFEFEVLSEIAPVKCAANVIQAIEKSVHSFDFSNTHLPSGAAHDTQIMASITQAGMIFVPSKEGRSHSAAEWTAWEDIENGANILLNTLLQLANDA